MCVIDMTVPKLMDGWSEEETTQEQYDWLKAKAEELAQLHRELNPKLAKAWGIMSEIQEVVDENQEWAEGIRTNDLDTAYLHCYGYGTLELLEQIMRKYGIWNPETDEREEHGSHEPIDTTWSDERREGYKY